jgi:hypothetical protein
MQLAEWITGKNTKGFNHLRLEVGASGLPMLPLQIEHATPSASRPRLQPVASCEPVSGRTKRTLSLANVWGKKIQY